MDFVCFALKGDVANRILRQGIIPTIVVEVHRGHFAENDHAPFKLVKNTMWNSSAASSVMRSEADVDLRPLYRIRNLLHERRLQVAQPAFRQFEN